MFLALGLVIVLSFFTHFMFYFRSNWVTRSDKVARLSPLFLDINLALLVMCLFLNARGIVELLRSVSRRAWVGVGLIALLAFVVVVWVAPRTHRIYFDEDIYGNIGLSISERGFALMTTEGQWRDGIFYLHRGEMNKQPNGYPYVLSLVYRVFGPGHDISYLPNSLAMPLAVVAVFLITLVLFEKENLALYAALIFATIPNNYRWYSTMAAEPLTALSTALTVLCALFYCLRPGLDRLLLLTSMAAFAVQFRIETMMIGLVLVLIVAFWRPKELRGNRLQMGLVLFLFLIPCHLAHVESVKEESWGAVKGGKFSLDYVWRESEPYDILIRDFRAPKTILEALRTGQWKKGNFYQNVRFFLFDDQYRFPAPYAYLFVLGILMGGPLRLYPDWDGSRFRDFLRGVVIEAPWKPKAVVLAWFGLFWGIFLFFYAGSFYYGADDRFTLLSLIPICITVAVAVETIERVIRQWVPAAGVQALLASAILLVLGRHAPVIRGVHHEAWLARYAHDWAVEQALKLPENSMVIAHTPSLFNLYGVGGIQMAVAANEPRRIEEYLKTVQGGVYLDWGFWSVIPDENSHKHATMARDNFDCREMASKSLGHATSQYKYTVRFYEVRKKAQEAPDAGKEEGKPPKGDAKPEAGEQPSSPAPEPRPTSDSVLPKTGAQLPPQDQSPDKKEPSPKYLGPMIVPKDGRKSVFGPPF
jgi:hypothetical protein